MKLTTSQRKAFNLKYDAIKRQSYSYGSKAKKWENCYRVKDGKRIYFVCGANYTAAEIAWIIHTDCLLPADGLQIDHICGDPVWNKDTGSRCFNYRHMRRKSQSDNLERRNCQNIIRKWYSKIYKYRKRTLSKNQLITPGPIYVANISQSDLSLLYDKIHYQPTGAYKKNHAAIQKRRQHKKEWIEGCVCTHKKEPCFINYN